MNEKEFFDALEKVKEDGVTCCGVLEAYHEMGYEVPFHRPVMIDWTTGDMKVGKWSIKMFQLTPSGNISRKGYINVRMNYCPFCGEKIREENEK